MLKADEFFLIMLVFVPLAFAAAFLGAPATLVFALSALAVVPLAKYIGEATEELTRYVGTAGSGLLNATFGNAPEFIIAFFALKAGLIDVVKATIVGSILGNLLLVLGVALIAGGLRHREQRFNATAAKTAGSSLLLVILALIIPAIFLATAPAGQSGAIGELSIVVAIVLLLTYIASLVFSLWTHQHLYQQDAASYLPKWNLGTSLIILFVATIATAVVSDVLVGAIQPTILTLGWTQTFIGVIVIAIVGNAAEHATAVRVALKNNVDLVLQITIGSATQIAMFVAPALVLISFLMPQHLDLVFSTFTLAALVLSVLVANAVVEDGKSNWFEGLQLLVAYVVIAAAFFLHP